MLRLSVRCLIGQGTYLCNLMKKLLPVFYSYGWVAALYFGFVSMCMGRFRSSEETAPLGGSRASLFPEFWIHTISESYKRHEQIPSYQKPLGREISSYRYLLSCSSFPPSLRSIFLRRVNKWVRR